MRTIVTFFSVLLLACGAASCQKADSERPWGSAVIYMPQAGYIPYAVPNGGTAQQSNKNYRIDAQAGKVHIFLGGGKIYQGCQTELLGNESSLQSDIGYLLQDDQRLDMNYVALHEGKRTNSEINASGVLKDASSKLFRGTIDFQHGSAESVGAEKEDVLLMGDDVVNQTIPLILCAEEDVKGSHGASIGQLDEETLFYMQARGISEEQAYALMADARIEAVCQKIPDETAQKLVRAYLGGDAADECEENS